MRTCGSLQQRVLLRLECADERGHERALDAIAACAGSTRHMPASGCADICPFASPCPCCLSGAVYLAPAKHAKLLTGYEGR